MTASAPARLSTNPLLVVLRDLGSEVLSRRRSGYPPGPADFDLRRTFQMTNDPLRVLLPLYEQYGPIFSVRILYERMVFMLGPEANHFVTVSNPQNFHWRESHFGDLIPLLGDGLLTTDGEYHDRARRIMMPAFHRERIATAVQTMADETERATAEWKFGHVIDIYEWMRNLAMRIAMRALFGFDPDERGRGAAAAEHFERALSFYGTDFHMRLLRGPGSPWRKMLVSRRVLDEIVLDEIVRRKSAGDLDRGDILGMLLVAEDEDGSRLSDREVRDQLMTLLFAGHDTSTSTLSFLMYELARHPHVLARLYEEQDRVLGDQAPTYDQLERGLPELAMALDETLRLYPPAWIGSRRAIRDFEFGGYAVPRGAWVHYCSWASHRLPEVFPEPEAFIPERFTPERKASLPKGAYIPFGAGSRICIGKRFGQTEILMVAALLLQRFRLELLPGRAMTVRQMPTLSPREPLLMRLCPREVVT
jgi:retinoid hydroxylase